MSGPKHQHFIPRSYMRNFAVLKEDVHFVEAKLKSELAPKDQPMAISNICVNKNLYTIPQVKGEDRFHLEKFYANEVDGIYPEIYKMLVDPNVTELSPEQRSKVLYTTMSLYFRTPHFLRINEKLVDKILDYGARNHQTNGGRIKFEFKQYKFDFDIKDIESAKENLRLDLKLDFLINHLDEWGKFVKHKINAGIYVLKINDDVNLISSDNPIIMNKVFQKVTDIFDNDVLISMSLDSKHYIQIMPNSIEGSNLVFRGERDKAFAIGKNYAIEEKSEDWIYGLPGSITAHLADQKKYGEHSEENIQSANKFIEKTREMGELMELIDRYGLRDKRVIDKAKELSRKDIHKDDDGLMKIINL